MCGFAGIVDLQRETSEETLVTQLVRMSSAISHRGPDDSGTWIDAAAGVALGFRRLSIIDLSVDGHQPMVSTSGRYIVVFNGEIYNFLQLREYLETRGHRFRGGSDTEVAVAAFEEWTVAEALKKFNGMFAFAIYDRDEQALIFARDRFGKKPLYFGWVSPSLLLFGSELKALSANTQFDDTIDQGALSRFLQYGYVPSPDSIYAKVKKLRPGSLLKISLERPGELYEEEFWSLESVIATRKVRQGSLEKAVDELDLLLHEAVKSRMISDVPIGAFLSGGIDSSLVVAMMQREASSPTMTFSIGLKDQAFDEAATAKAVAAHLGTRHTEFYLDPAEVLTLVPSIAALYDEPFADSSQLPTAILSRLARSSVTVVLTGDGGDEAFGGYNRHIWSTGSTARLLNLPQPVRRGLARSLASLSASRLDSVYQSIEPLIPQRLRVRHAGMKVHKLARALRWSNASDAYGSLTSFWEEGFPVLRGERPAPAPLMQIFGLDSVAEQMMYTDSLNYLVDDILVKVDRATMSVGLEARSPLLDHRVVEFAWNLPLEWKISRSQGKQILRRLLQRYVPPSLTERPKHGFGVPLAQWLRGPLRDWAESLLNRRKITRSGYLDPAIVGQRWEDFLSNRGSSEYDIWNVLMFQSWLEQHGTTASSCERQNAANPPPVTAAVRGDEV
jgi:asparagine synthase (glutamine-hydrolysing)